MLLLRNPPDSGAASLPRRAVIAGPLVGAATFATMAVAALALDLPINDPDGALGSPFILITAVLAVFIALDVVPQAARTAGWPPSGFREAATDRLRERWRGPRGLIVVGALLGWYLTYVGYRNLKSYLPFARDDNYDAWLLESDRTLAFGEDPAAVLHGILGEGISAHVLSVAYVTFLGFVPLSLGIAVVWQRQLHRGLWYVTSMNFAWILGVASYYALPSLGPVYVEPSLFADLPATGVSALQQSLLEHRGEVLASPHAAEGVQSIAAFASLHVAIVFVAALVAQLLRLRRAIRVGMWTFLALTIVATIYFGWHYILDDVAGLVIGGLAVALGALCTGHSLRPGRTRAPVLARHSSARLT